MTTTDRDIPAFLDRRPQAQPAGGQFAKPLIYTFTNVNTYRNCPHRFFRQYLKKDLGPFEKTKEMQWGDDVHLALEQRMGGKPLPANMRQWEPIAAPIAARKPRTEQQLAITAEGKPTDYWGKDAFFRGKNDITLGASAKALLLDWKTGRKWEDPFELATNAMLVHAHNPHLTEIKGRFVWLKENALGKEHDVSDTRSTWAHVNNIVEEIRDCQSGNEWFKKKGPLCGYCPVKDCENWFDAKADK